MYQEASLDSRSSIYLPMVGENRGFDGSLGRDSNNGNITGISITSVVDRVRQQNRHQNTSSIHARDDAVSYASLRRLQQENAQVED